MEFLRKILEKTGSLDIRFHLNGYYFEIMVMRYQEATHVPVKKNALYRVMIRYSFQGESRILNSGDLKINFASDAMNVVEGYILKALTGR